MPQPIIIVQGAQYGSEGKGGIAAHLCQLYDVDYAVRTGAINAGHTVYYHGKPYKMQQLPTGWVNPNTQLVIGPGAYIHPTTIARECNEVDTATRGHVEERLHIDYRVGIHLDQHQEEAEAVNRHHSIGATGKGCAEAIIGKIDQRGCGGMLFKDTLYGSDTETEDTVDLLMTAYSDNKRILIEGTQGSLLDLHTGPYPYVTSRMTSAANWVAEAGLSPALRYDIVLVARTMPIRVAGNSGPLPFETSWPHWMHMMNAKARMAGKPHLIHTGDIYTFEDAIRAAALKHDRPAGSDGLDQHAWSAQDRVKYQKALSEINTEALSILMASYPAAHGAVTQYIEMTTVTHKPRRIAGLDVDVLSEVVRREHPSRLFLTFLNYVFPELWGATSASDLGIEHRRWIANLSSSLGGISIDWVTTGPLPENVIFLH